MLYGNHCVNVALSCSLGGVGECFGALAHLNGNVGAVEVVGGCWGWSRRPGWDWMVKVVMLTMMTLLSNEKHSCMEWILGVLIGLGWDTLIGQGMGSGWGLRVFMLKGRSWAFH